MKTVRVGAWDGGEPQVVQVADNATVNDALRAANLSLARTQSVTSFSDTQNVSLTSSVIDGETYLLTGNQVSGH